MSLRSILKQWTYRKRVRDWPERAGCALEVALNPGGVQGLGLGSHFDEASKLGRPVVTVIGATMDVRLDFLKQGVTLEYEDDRLTYIGIIVALDREMQDEIGLCPVTATLRHASCMTLTPEVSAEKMIELLGTPTDDDRDESERILYHQVNGCVIESEFTPKNKLRRLNLFPVY